MRRRKKYKLEFLTGIFEEWRFYTISEKILIRSKEYEKAMKATYELVNKVKSKVSEDAFRDIEEIVNSVCAENNICSRLVPCCLPLHSHMSYSQFASSLFQMLISPVSLL